MTEAGSSRKSAGRGGAAWRRCHGRGLFQDIVTSAMERDRDVLGLRGSAGGYHAEDDLASSSRPLPLSFNQKLTCLP